MSKLVVCIGLFLASSLLASNTLIHLDGKEVSVYFNDGDTFQMFHGAGQKTSARLKGYNALEAYGPVHQWGTWKAEELYQNAEEATREARAGHWTCTTEGTKDKYGRLLANCPDLAKHLISKGLAHAMFVGADDYNQELVDVQQQAIHSKVGMWAKGVPDYILTSVHSSAEKELNGKAYDRFVSVHDGRSSVVNHSNAYSSCEKIAYSPNEHETASSMIYVPFEKRYGLAKAVCLQHAKDLVEQE